MAAKSQATNWEEEKKLNEEQFWIILPALFKHSKYLRLAFSFFQWQKIGKSIRKYSYKVQEGFPSLSLNATS